MPCLKISVALCTYNGERFLSQQLSSIRQQSTLPDEVIAFDDRSTDRTIAILREFAASSLFPVKIFENPKNLGYAANFEQAIRACGGDLIALSDQDDIWHPHRLERSLQEFTDHPEVGLVFSDADLIDDEGTRSGATLWKTLGFAGRRKRKFLAGNFVALAKYRFVTGATLMFRARLRPYVLPIPSGWVHDEWIAMVAASFSDLRPIDQRLIGYRIHSSQQLGFQNKLQRQAEGNHWRRLAASVGELEQLCDVLATLDAPPRPEVLLAYRRHLQFLLFRSKLPANRGLRLMPVLKHLAGYGEHASGWKSLLKDLIVPGPQS
jgi:glycosyltransferase involved in cell wall biosynthesis